MIGWLQHVWMMKLWCYWWWNILNFKSSAPTDIKFDIEIHEENDNNGHCMEDGLLFRLHFFAALRWWWIVGRWSLSDGRHSPTSWTVLKYFFLRPSVSLVCRRSTASQRTLMWPTRSPRVTSNPPRSPATRQRSSLERFYFRVLIQYPCFRWIASLQYHDTLSHSGRRFEESGFQDGCLYAHFLVSLLWMNLRSDLIKIFNLLERLSELKSCLVWRQYFQHLKSVLRYDINLPYNRFFVWWNFLIIFYLKLWRVLQDKVISRSLLGSLN